MVATGANVDKFLNRNSCSVMGNGPVGMTGSVWNKSVATNKFGKMLNNFRFEASSACNIPSKSVTVGRHCEPTGSVKGPMCSFRRSACGTAPKAISKSKTSPEVRLNPGDGLQEKVSSRFALWPSTELGTATSIECGVSKCTVRCMFAESTSTSSALMLSEYHRILSDASADFARYRLNHDALASSFVK